MRLDFAKRAYKFKGIVSMHEWRKTSFKKASCYLQRYKNGIL